jgi:hypothetical protein
VFAVQVDDGSFVAPKRIGSREHWTATAKDGASGTTGRVIERKLATKKTDTTTTVEQRGI